MTLFRERLPAYREAPELVLFHGWGANSDCWRSALPRLRQSFNVTLVDLPGHGLSADCPADFEGFLAELMPQLPARACYLGWSLGGMVATAIAARFPERVSALIGIACNASFVQRENWSEAMPEADFLDFLARFEQHPERGLRRFDKLQGQGEKTQPDSRLVTPETQAALLQWLVVLDNREALQSLSCPALFLFGENDALVPASAAKAVSALNPQVQSELIVDSGHLPFVSQGESLWSKVETFCTRQNLVPAREEAHLDKRSIARSFSRAAQSYDGVADLQRRVADSLLDDLPGQAAFNSTLDLGCGTGYSLPSLAGFSRHLLALDLAEGMLHYARQLEGRDAQVWLCGDAEDLPLADNSLDLIFSSLSVQWCENIAAVFAEAYRVLKPGGEMLVSTLGPETLFELREAGQAADQHTHVNRFLPRERVQSGIDGSGLTLKLWRESQEVLTYTSLRELMAELKNLGAHNVNSGRAGGLTGKQALRRFIDAYEHFRNAEGLLPASYQVWYLHLRKPE